MSIDFYYKSENGQTIAKEQLIKELSDSYDIVDVKIDQDDKVTYFAVNPKDQKNVIYEKGYEFYLQDDGIYWHPILTRDDDKFDIENSEVMLISSRLSLELDPESSL